MVVRVHQFALLAWMLAACGSDPTADPDARPPDGDASPDAAAVDASTVDASTAPYVVETNPLAGALGAEGDVVITAVFSEPLDPATIDAARFTVVGPLGEVEGIFTFDGTTTAQFRATDELTKLESYTVTIAAEVSDLDGHTLGEPYTWTFTVAERWWRAPQQVSVAGDGAWSPTVGCDGAGNVMTTWGEPAGSFVTDLYASRRVGSTWEDPVVLNSVSGGIRGRELEILPSGDAIVAWTQSGIWVRQYRTTTGWSAPVRLEEGSLAVTGPQVDINAAGDAVAIWERVDEIAEARYTEASGWSTPTTLSTGMGHALPRIALADSGDAIALWWEAWVTHHIWSRTYSAASGWGATVDLDAETEYSQGIRDLAMLPSGEALAMWTEGGSIFDVFVRRFVPGTGWSATTTLHSDPSVAPGSVRIAMDPDGNAMATWYDPGSQDVVSRSFDVEADTWSAPITSAASVEGAGLMSLAISDDGQAFVAWEEKRDRTFNMTIVGAHYTADGFVASDLEDLGASDRASHALAACPDGTAIVIWTETSGGLWSADYR